MSAFAVSMILGLAACGTSTEPAASDPTATAAIIDPPTINATDNATDTPADMGMGNMETPIPAPTDAMGMVVNTIPTEQPAGQTEPAESAAGQSEAGVTQISATLREWGLDLSQSEVPAGKIVFTVANTGMFPHNLTVTDSSGNDLGHTPTFPAAEGPKTLEVELQPGTYTIICSLPGHAARGQKAELVVK